MKKLFSLLLLALVATVNVLAGDVSEEEALQIASQFISSHSGRKSSHHLSEWWSVTPSIAHTEHSKVATGKNNVYVVNLGDDQGFVVVSGEDSAEDVLLGYCDHGTFAYDNCPVQLKDLLASYSEQVDYLRNNPMSAAPTENIRQWPDYMGSIVVGPLLTTTWNQWAPYNAQCPIAKDGGMAYYEGRCPSGCVPTAIAQIMNYWKWPNSTIGKIKVDVNSQGEYVYEDFSGHTYDWDNMLDNYDHDYTEAQATAVAKLMADIGKAWGTMYSPEESPTSLGPQQIYENYGYDPGIKRVFGVTAADLQDELKAELDEGRPVLYCGHPTDYMEYVPPKPGHALVCDGYTDRDYFHFNYGWGGHFDGFYKNALLPLYSFDTEIWTGVRPYDAEHKVIGDIEYGLLKNRTAEILSYMRKNESGITLEIPATVKDDAGNDYKVTRIRKHAFMTNCHFEKMVFGENIEAIDRFAFLNCRINELVLSDKMEQVPDNAFELAGVHRLTIGANIKRIGKRAFYPSELAFVTSKSPAFEAGEEAFSGTGDIDSGDWLRSITRLGRRAFVGKTFTQDPPFDNLTEIGSEAFFSCSFKKQFTLPSKLRKISTDAFKGTVFYGFAPNEANPYFTSTIAGLLYNKNQTSLVLAPTINTDIDRWLLPETLVKLEEGSVMSMYGSGQEFGFEIPASVVEMEGAFSNCERLRRLRCLALEPPVISDDTFNDKIFTNRPNIALYVPQGTAELYRNAPGWSRFPNIIDDQEYTPLAAQEREYYMVVDLSGDGQRISIPVSEVSSMEISDDGQNMIINRNGKDAVTTTVAAVDSIKWVPGFVYENAEIFNLNAENLTAEAQKCSVTFNATVIDEIDGDVQLCVRNAVLAPNALEGAVDGFAVDLSLSNGQHELTGTAKITIPISVGEGQKLCAAYYNEESGELEPVLFTYDEVSSTATIITNHLSTYEFFKIDEDFARSIAERLLVEYNPFIAYSTLDEAAKLLLKVLTSDDPNSQMVQEFKNNLQFYQNVGLDFLWNAVNGIAGPWGFDPYKLNKVSELLGYFGTALSILDVAAADIKGDDIGVAAGTLNTIVGFTAGQMANAIGTSTMTAAMASVAFIGIALNKFGTAALAKKEDYLRTAYRYYYSVAGYRVCEGQSKYKKDSGYGMGKHDKFTHKYFYTLKDWYEYFYPVVAEGNMTEQQFSYYVENVLRLYCDRFWNDNADATIDAYTYAQEQGYDLGYVADMQAEREKISNEYFAELMQVQMPAVFASIRETIATEAKNRAIKAAKDVSDEVNTKLGFRIVDSQWKEGETSKYAGWKIGFSEIPSTLKGKERLHKKLNEKGRAGLGWITEYAIMKNNMPAQITLYDPDDKPQKTFDFKLPEGPGNVYVDIDLAKDGVKVEAVDLPDLELTYDPARLELPWTPTMYTYYYDEEGNLRKQYSEPTGDGTGLLYVPLNNSITKKVRFQRGLEKFFKQHDFITVDQAGNVKIGDDILVAMSGGTGSCPITIDVKHDFEEKTKEQYPLIFNNAKEEQWYRLLNLLNGTIQHQIKCEVQVVHNADDSYTVTYEGTGTYKVDAEVVSHVDNVDGEAFGEEEEQKITVDDITTAQTSSTGDVKLKYSTTLKQYAE